MNETPKLPPAVVIGILEIGISAFGLGIVIGRSLLFRRGSDRVSRQVHRNWLAGILWGIVGGSVIAAEHYLGNEIPPQAHVFIGLAILVCGFLIGECLGEL